MNFLFDVFELFRNRADYFVNLFLEHIWISFLAVLMILFVGIPLGILITRYKKISMFVIGFTNFLYTIPSIAFFAVMIPIVGLGIKNALLALFIYGLLPVVRNTFVGIQEVDNSVIDAARGMGSTNVQILINVELPLALPVIIAGIRTMVVMTISLAGIAAFIGAGGLGTAIWRGISTYNVKMVFAGGILIALLAISADGLMGLLEKKVIKITQGIERKGGFINE